MTALLGLLSGLVVGLLVYQGLRLFLFYSFPPPPSLDMATPETLAAVLANFPAQFLVMILLAWSVGVLSGGYTATRIARQGPVAAWMTGLFMIVTGLFPMMIKGYPMWFVIMGMLLTGLFGYLAGILGDRVTQGQMR
ncbi:MAG: hypothetical protein ACK41P_05160 [Asticcacaulis sp.]